MSIRPKHSISIDLDSKVKPVDVVAKQRTTFDLEFTVTRAGVAQDLTGVTPSITYGPSDGSYAIGVTGTVTDAANGVCIVTPTTTDTDYTGSMQADVILTDGADVVIHKFGNLILHGRAADDTAGTSPSGTVRDYTSVASYVGVDGSGPFTEGLNITFGTADANGRVPIIAAAGGGSGGHVIQEEGTPLTQRTALNFIGAAITAADDAGNDATTVTVDVSGKQNVLAEGAFVDGDKTKLDGIQALADVTSTTNVTAAGALMDSEVDVNIKTLSLPGSTTISTFGKTLVDDADAATARATLGVTPQEIDLSPGIWQGPKGTGANDDCGLASDDDSTLTGGSYDLIGVGVDTANATQQSKAMQVQFTVPASWSAFKTTGCFEFELWAESNTSTNCKYDVFIYGISDIGGSINTIYSGAGKTFTTANTPQQLSIDVADLTSSTLPAKIIININLYTANDFATIFAGGVARGQ